MAVDTADDDAALIAGIKRLMAEGLTLMAALGELGLPLAQGERRMAASPAFREAVAIGEAKRAASLERRAIEGDKASAVTYALAALKVLNPADFRERPVPVPDEDATPAIEAGDPERLARAIAFLAARNGTP